jgi:7-carboxy-7-deazaguanine synthase
MRIAEIYPSVQGEGVLTGTPSLFVRASGCNLRCWYCDTPFTSWRPEGDDLAVEEIVRQVLAGECEHVVLTGGEPMLFAELVPLCAELRRLGRHITIETAGTLHLSLECDLMSISPKRANSTPSAAEAGSWSERHEHTRHVPQVIKRLITEYPYQFKFVIDTLADCEDVEAYLQELPQIARERVLLMPQGTTQEQLAKIEKWLKPYCEAHGLTYCPRMHIQWYGFRRGT